MPLDSIRPIRRIFLLHKKIIHKFVHPIVKKTVGTYNLKAFISADS